MTFAVTDNPAEHRFELKAGDHVAVACYTLAPGLMTFTHTEVPSALSGQGIGSALVRDALDQARHRGLKIVPRCSFVAAFIAKHAEFADMVV